MKSLYYKNKNSPSFSWASCISLTSVCLANAELVSNVKNDVGDSFSSIDTSHNAKLPPMSSSQRATVRN